MRFFQQPPPRLFASAEPEAARFARQYVGSAGLAGRIVAGIIVVPYLGFAIFQLVALGRGRAYASDVIGTLLGVGLGLGLFVLLPLGLFFRSMRRRNETRMEGLEQGTSSWVAPYRVEAIMHRAGDGPASPAWEAWLWLPAHGSHPAVRVVLQRREAQAAPEQVFVVESPRGDCLVMWPDGPVYPFITADQRTRSIPGGPGPQ